MVLPSPLLGFPRATAFVATSCIVAVPLYYVARRLLRSLILHKLTVLRDIESVGTPRVGQKIKSTAVVCGGSFAGLFAARVCADHFARVIVVEPEAWTFTDEAHAPPSFETRQIGDDAESYTAILHKRTRVYQYASIHAYQVLLLRFARKVFQEFDKAALNFGLLIQPADMNGGLAGFSMPTPWREYGGKLPDTIVGLRRELEPLFRKLVTDTCSNVEFVQGTVTKFNNGQTDDVLEAVSVRTQDGSVIQIPCALVADCTGISQLGFKLFSRDQTNFTLQRDEYDPDIGYSTLELPLTATFKSDLRKLAIPSLGDGGRRLYDTDNSPYWFVYNPDPREDSRLLGIGWRDQHGVIMAMGGWGTELPVTLAQARAFTEKVKNQRHVPAWFYKILDLLEPVADQCVAFPARANSCSKIHYEREAKHLPRNFVALGDAGMRVNPRFGQGVTKCAIGAITLDGVLRQCVPSDKRFGATYFSRMDARTISIWDGTRLSDYDNASTVPLPGETHETGGFSRWFRSSLLPVLTKNPAAASAMWHVVNFLAPPTDLFAPSIVASVLWENVMPTPKP